MMTIFSYLHRTTFVERCCNTFVSSIPLCALWDSTISGITEGDTSDSSDAKGASGLACEMIYRMALAIAKRHLYLSPVSWLYRREIRVGRSRQHSLTHKALQWEIQAVSWGLWMPESHPQPWGGVKLESAAWTSTAELKSVLRVQNQSQCIQHSM